MNPTFELAFKRYCNQIQKGEARKVSHDQRRALFFEFLHDGFGLSAENVELEKGLYGLKVQGYIDALYRDIVLEFKRDLDAERETGKEEVEKYIKGLKGQGHHFGIITDGIIFEVYFITVSGLNHLETCRLVALSPEGAFVWLDRYFFSAHTATPTADDLAARFGPRSPVFVSSMSDLGEAFKLVKKEPSVEVKVDQWGKLLTRVYGSSVGDNELYLRHTYLSVLSRLLAYLALFRKKPQVNDLDGLITGSLFVKRGLQNFAEEDFFVWLLEAKILKLSKAWLWNLIQYFSVYDVSHLTGDLLKELYQVLVDPETRHDLGEFYTPDWLASLTLESTGLRYPQKVLDPACGSGTFLAAAIKRIRDQGFSGSSLVRWVVSEMCGLDVHPLAVTISKATLVLSLSEDLKKVHKAITLPVYMADAIPKFESTQEGPLLFVHIGKTQAFRIPAEAAKNPDKLDRVIDHMVQFAKAGGAFDLKKKGFLKKLTGLGISTFHWVWTHNLKVLHDFITAGRNTIWAYILKNQYRPLFLFRRPFDVVVGNPPWLAYKFVKEPIYQEQIRELTFQYGLLEKTDVRNFPHMDTSTLFFAYSADRYLRPGGKISFVMPYSVITGSKVHSRFKDMKFGSTTLSWDRIIDCKGVQPLFNVPSCVVVCSRTS